jgi:hypothetical protein
MGRLYLAGWGASTGCPLGKTEATDVCVGFQATIAEPMRPSFLISRR